MPQKIQASVEVPLPDDVPARAALFGKVAAEWSVLISSIERLCAEARLPPPKVQTTNGEHIAEPKQRKRGRPPKRKRR
jgi:hypothetical protein